MRPVYLVLVIACAGHRAGSPPAPRTDPYRALFVRGKAWTLPIEIVDGHKQGDAYVPDHTNQAAVACRVDDVRAVGDARVARIACAKPYADLLIVGQWVAQPAGLYHAVIPVDDPDDLAALGEEDLLLAAIPEERQHSHALGPSQESTEAFSYKGSWCVRSSTTADLDRRDFRLCFDASGITGGGEVVIVGPTETWRRVTFGRVPADPDDPTVAHD